MSQSLPWLTWVYAIQALTTFLFGIGVFIFIAIRPSDQSQAKKFALIGFGIQLSTTIMGLVAPILLTLRFSSASLGTGMMLINFVGNILGMVSTGLIVAAIVTGRRPDRTETDTAMPETTPGTERPRPTDGKNPYAV